MADQETQFHARSLAALILRESREAGWGAVRLEISPDLTVSAVLSEAVSKPAAVEADQ